MLLFMGMSAPSEKQQQQNGVEENPRGETLAQLRTAANRKKGIHAGMPISMLRIYATTHMQPIQVSNTTSSKVDPKHTCALQQGKTDKL